RDAEVAKRELLSGRVHVVELERRDGPVVAAQRAPAARLGNEDLLYLAPSPRYGVGATPNAAEVATSLADERRRAVPGALAQSPLGRRGGAGRAEAVLAQPVEHHRLADPKLRGHLGDRAAGGDELLQEWFRRRGHRSRMTAGSDEH